MKSIFSHFDVRLFEAENGKVALDCLNRETIDLVLLDARMPVMDGEETLRSIRQLENEQKRDVKVILLTAAGNELDDLLEQVDGFVSKPFTQEALINEINKVISNHHQEDAVTSVECIEKQEEKTVDFSNLKTLSGSDLAFYEDMLSTFITTTNNSYQNMKAAFINNDMLLLANEAHKIASPCRHIGAVKLHGLLKEIEQLARKENDAKQINKRMRELDEEVSVVLTLVNHELTSIH